QFLFVLAFRKEATNPVRYHSPSLHRVSFARSVFGFTRSAAPPRDRRGVHAARKASGQLGCKRKKAARPPRMSQNPSAAHQTASSKEMVLASAPNRIQLRFTAQREACSAA